MAGFSIEDAYGDAPAQKKGGFSLEEAYGLDAPTPERGPIPMLRSRRAHGLRGRAGRRTAQ
jgi:hypothetical protein